MRRRVVLGAYVPGSTPAHRLDPRVKVAMLLIATVATFAAPFPAGSVVVLLGLVVVMALSGTSPAAVLAGVRPAALVLCVTLLANAVILVGQPGISLAGLFRGLAAATRIVLVVGFALAFSATTVPPAIADALSSLLRPLERLGLPVGSVATSASIALRFIPLTLEEVERIRCAQRARDARLDEGGVVSRLRGWGQVLVPLIVSLVRRADELGAAMGDRCYSGSQTIMARRLTVSDGIVVLATVAWAALAVLVGLAAPL